MSLSKSTRGTAGLPDTLRCVIGSHWAPTSQFSKSQQDAYASKARYGSATPYNSGAACRLHSGQPTTELVCLGPCGRKQPIGSFSKNSRRCGKQWCHECTDWQLSSEHGETMPIPGGVRMPDELDPAQLLSRQMKAVLMNESDDDDDSDTETLVVAEDVEPVVKQVVTPVTMPVTMPVTKPVAAAATEGDDEEDAEDLTSTDVNNVFAPPPYMDNEQVTGDLSDDGDKASDSASLADASVISDWNSYGPSFSSDHEFSSEIEVNSELEVHSELEFSSGPDFSSGPMFNAYGPTGHLTRMAKVKTATCPSTTSDDTQKSYPSVQAGKSGWSKPSQRKYEPKIPSYLQYESNPDASCAASDTKDYDEDGYLSDDLC